MVGAEIIDLAALSDEEISMLAERKAAEAAAAGIGTDAVKESLTAGREATLELRQAVKEAVAASGGTLKNTSGVLAGLVTNRYGRWAQLSTFFIAAMSVGYIGKIADAAGQYYFLTKPKIDEYNGILANPYLTPDQKDKLIQGLIDSMKTPPSMLGQVQDIALIVVLGAVGILAAKWFFSKPRGS